MRNIEKYKDEIFNRINECELAKAIYLVKEGKIADCDRKCQLCRDAYVRWLLEEAKEPILNEEEKEYLSAVIRPFRKKIASISKFETWDDSSQYIYIEMTDSHIATLPVFPKGTMYKGMKDARHYSLKELGQVRWIQRKFRK